MTNRSTHRSGEYFVAAELLWPAAREVRVQMPAHVVASDVEDTRKVLIKVKTKRTGTWQTSTELGLAPGDLVPDANRF